MRRDKQRAERQQTHRHARWLSRALLLSASTTAMQAMASGAFAQINVPSGDTAIQTAPAEKGNSAVNDSATAGTSNRGFDFSSVGADFVSEVDILKTPDATLSAGAIGATINIKYPKPFDHPGLRLVGSASAGYSPEDGHTTPNGGFLFSDTFLDNKVGLLVDVAYQDHKTEANHINSQGWEGTQIAPSQLAAAPPRASTANSLNSWYIQDYGIYQEHTNTSREDARMVLQYRPQSNILVTLNDDYNRERVTTDQNGYSVWFNAGNLTNVMRDGNGTLTSFSQPNSPTDFQSQINKEVLENNEYGLNAKWDVTNDFTVDFDVDRAISWLNPNGQNSEVDMDVGYGNGAINGSNTGVTLGTGGGLPYVTGYGPNGNAAAFTNGFIGSHVLPISSTQNRDTVNQAKIQGNWHNEDTQVRFGVQYISDHDHLSVYDDFTNNDWQAYSGYGPASGSPTGVALPQSWFNSTFSTSGFIPGYSGAGNLPPNILKYSPYQVINYLQSLGNPLTKNIPGFNYAGKTAYAGMFQTVLAPNSFQQISNDTYSGYLTFSHKFTVADMPLQANFGLREDLTHSVSAGLGQLPTLLQVQSGDRTAFSVTKSSTTAVRTGNFYSYLLPNVDLGLSVTPQIKVRLDASRTLTRPPLSNLTPVTSLATSERVGALVATGGNPTLQPFVAFYDKSGVQARIAANWRDSYLDSFGQHQNNSAFGTEPTFVNANWTADFSTSYDVTKQLSVYFEALNLTDSGYSTRGRFSNQFLDIISYGRRFNLGAHFRY